MSTQPVTLTSPSDLLAVIPHLLGLHPSDSLVVVALHDRRVGLLQRLDLPAPADTGRAAHTLVRHLLGQNPDEALLVGYETTPGDSTPALDAIAQLLAPTGVHVQDRLVVRNGRWPSLDHTDGRCLEHGTPLAVSSIGLTPTGLKNLTSSGPPELPLRWYWQHGRTGWLPHPAD